MDDLLNAIGGSLNLRIDVPFYHPVRTQWRNPGRPFHANLTTSGAVPGERRLRDASHHHHRVPRKFSCSGQLPGGEQMPHTRCWHSLQVHGGLRRDSGYPRCLPPPRRRRAGFTLDEWRQTGKRYMSPCNGPPRPCAHIHTPTTTRTNTSYFDAFDAFDASRNNSTARVKSNIHSRSQCARPLTMKEGEHKLDTKCIKHEQQFGW